MTRYHRAPRLESSSARAPRALCRGADIIVTAIARLADGGMRDAESLLDQRLASYRPDRHDPLAGALAHDLDAAVGPQVDGAQAGQLRQAQSGVEEQQHDGAVAGRGTVEQAAHGTIRQRLDELVGHARAAQRAQGLGRGQLLGRAPVAEDLEAAHVAGAGRTNRSQSDSTGGSPRFRCSVPPCTSTVPSRAQSSGVPDRQSDRLSIIVHERRGLLAADGNQDRRLSDPHRVQPRVLGDFGGELHD